MQKLTIGVFNRHAVCICLAVIAATLATMPVNAIASMLNGGSGVPGDDPPIIVDDDWYATSLDSPPAFFWGSGAGALNVEGPFTFVATDFVFVDVTDDFSTGDQFEVFDFDVSLGLTPLVAAAVAPEVGPQAAFHNPAYSRRRFALDPGAHSITIATVTNPYDSGRGYIRVKTVPEPSTLLLAALGMLGVGWLRRKRA